MITKDPLPLFGVVGLMFLIENIIGGAYFIRLHSKAVRLIHRILYIS